MQEATPQSKILRHPTDGEGHAAGFECSCNVTHETNKSAERVNPCPACERHITKGTDGRAVLGGPVGTTPKAAAGGVEGPAAESLSTAQTDSPGFTPGPWVARQQLKKSGESIGWIIDWSGGRIGWSWFATSDPNEGEGAPHTQGGANARLMAAAPDLYAACEKVEDLLVQLEAGLSFKGPPSHIAYISKEQGANVAKSAAEMLRAAIERAKAGAA